MKCPMIACCTMSLLSLFTTYSETKSSEYLSKPWLFTPKIPEFRFSQEISEYLGLIPSFCLLGIKFLTTSQTMSISCFVNSLGFCWKYSNNFTISSFVRCCFALCLNHLFIIFSSLCLTNLRQESHQITQKKRKICAITLLSQIIL